MKRATYILISVISSLLFSNADLYAQHGYGGLKAPDSKSCLKSIRYLASVSLEGREAGTKGAETASEYIASKMKEAGLKPYVNMSGWFQEFEALAYNKYRDSMTFISQTEPGLKKTRASSFISSIYNPDYKGEGSDTVNLHNVLGFIEGRDTTHIIIIGAHFDHLGIRSGKTYFGADDNASGVAGVLSLASEWSRFGKKPPCNLIFASWTAEEKGEIGSSYFVNNLGANRSKILITFNMDMISRSAPEDSTFSIVSIGTLPKDINLRNIATKANRSLKDPLILDMWDVTGHYGSDYAYFAESGIPVMTFFSGFEKDYHTPGDVADKVDLHKMQKILNLVNKCIIEVADSLNSRLSDAE